MGGVDIYDHNKKNFSHASLKEISSCDARCFYEDNKNNMWIGTSSGIFIVNTQTYENIIYAIGTEAVVFIEMTDGFHFVGEDG